MMVEKTNQIQWDRYRYRYKACESDKKAARRPRPTTLLVFWSNWRPRSVVPHHLEFELKEMIWLPRLETVWLSEAPGSPGIRSIEALVTP